MFTCYTSTLLPVCLKVCLKVVSQTPRSSLAYLQSYVGCTDLILQRLQEFKQLVIRKLMHNFVDWPVMCLFIVTTNLNFHQ